MYGHCYPMIGPHVHMGPIKKRKNLLANLAKSSFGESQKCTYLYSTSPLMPTTSLPEKMHISCILYRYSIYFCSQFFSDIQRCETIAIWSSSSFPIYLHPQQKPGIFQSKGVIKCMFKITAAMDGWMCGSVWKIVLLSLLFLLLLFLILLLNSIIFVIDIFKCVMKCMLRITANMGTMVLSKNIVLKSLMKPDMTQPCFDKDCSQITDEAGHETSSSQVLSLKPRSQDGVCSFS